MTLLENARAERDKWNIIVDYLESIEQHKTTKVKRAAILKTFKKRNVKWTPKRRKEQAERMRQLWLNKGKK